MRTKPYLGLLLGALLILTQSCTTAVGGAFRLPPPKMVNPPTEVFQCQDIGEQRLDCYLISVKDLKAILDYAKAQCLNQGLSKRECRANEPF